MESICVSIDTYKHPDSQTYPCTDIHMHIQMHNTQINWYVFEMNEMHQDAYVSTSRKWSDIKKKWERAKNKKRIPFKDHHKLLLIL